MNLVEVHILMYENALDEMEARQRRMRQQMVSLGEGMLKLGSDIEDMRHRIAKAREEWLRGAV